MISKKTKKFRIEDLDYRFDFQSFSIYVEKYAKVKKTSKTEVFELIAQTVCVTPEAVKQWNYGNNGPSEIDIIQKAAALLNVKDYLNLMKKAEEDEKMKLSNLQIESLKRIYDDVIEYLNDFYKTDGFTGVLWYVYKDQGYKDPEDKIYEYAEEQIEKVLLTIQKEYFYLHDTDVYSEILEYSENDLYDIFDGKLGYAYRFEAEPDGNPTTQDDYGKALKRLNEIVEKYT